MLFMICKMRIKKIDSLKIRIDTLRYKSEKSYDECKELFELIRAYMKAHPLSSKNVKTKKRIRKRQKKEL